MGQCIEQREELKNWDTRLQTEKSKFSEKEQELARMADIISGLEREIKELSLSNQKLQRDRKSTRLNSSHLVISYAVFCLKKQKNTLTQESNKAC